MRILGADGLTVGTGALNQIASGYLVNGDACMAKYDDKFHFYILEAGHGGVQNLPTVVAPVDGLSTKRWVLKGIFVAELEAIDIFTNTISQASSGTPLVINDIVSFNGNVVTFTNTTTAPFAVNSTTLVQNLNAEYLGDIHWSDWGIESFVTSKNRFILQGVDTVNVIFDEARFNTSYAILTEISNTVTNPPSLIYHIITDKTLTGFTVKLSSKTPDPFYTLQYVIFGDNIDYAEYDLQNYDGTDNIVDYTGLNQITLL